MTVDPASILNLFIGRGKLAIPRITCCLLGSVNSLYFLQSVIQRANIIYFDIRVNLNRKFIYILKYLFSYLKRNLYFLQILQFLIVYEQFKPEIKFDKKVQLIT